MHKANVTEEGVFPEPLSVFIIARVHVHALSLKCTVCLLWILSEGMQFASEVSESAPPSVQTFTYSGFSLQLVPVHYITELLAGCDLQI